MVDKSHPLEDVCGICQVNKADPKFHLEIPVCNECIDVQAKNLKIMRETRKKFYPEIDQITGKIFLGNQDASQDKILLKSKGITHILVAGRDLETPFPEEFTYFQIEIDDSTFENIYIYFKQCYDFINQADVCFVHCAAGVSRSASIVISFLMRDKQMKCHDAIKFVKNKRSAIHPNTGFMKQLKALEEELELL